MDDKAHVGLVNAHAKGVGGHHHRGPVVEEVLLVSQALLVLQAPVVAGGGVAPLPQGVADLLHGLAGAAVHNAAALPALRQLVLGAAHLKVEVGPVKAGDGDPGVTELQQGEDVLPHPGRGRGRKGRHHRPPGQLGQKLRDGQVAGAEVLPPLGDAVGLVHGHHGDGRAFGEVQKLRGQQPLRRHVDDFVHPGPGVVQGLLVLPPGEAAVEVGPPHAVLHQGGHLVPHQGDKGRHHQRDALQQQSGHLVAQGFPRPRGQNAHRVPAGQQGVYQLLLPRAEGGVAKVLF